jgi:predicted phage terminase large subunit-like protein
MKWSIVYEKAERADGSLLFPERLSREKLLELKKAAGSYHFANQYQNEIIPLEDRKLKPEWLRYFKELPAKVHTFAFIDPALSETSNADFTALCVIQVDANETWYLTHAQRFKINPTQVVQLVFDVYSQLKPKSIGIEDVAYQKALLYMIEEEKRRRHVPELPVVGIKPTPDKTKEMRISGLVPRFEWNRLLIAQGLTDFEIEYNQFPRGAHDDLLDALAYMEKIVFYPEKEKPKNVQPNPQDSGYEDWYRNQLIAKSNRNANEYDDT